MNRKSQQGELLFKAGQLLGPLLKIAENPESFDSDEITRAVARFCADAAHFSRATLAFSQGEPGHDYEPQYFAASAVLSTLRSRACSPDRRELLEFVPQARDSLLQELSSIPVTVEACIYAAHSPFSTYCLMKDLCSTVRKTVVWVDRYFDHTIFHRYLADVPPTALITLLTWPRDKSTSRADERRYDQFLDVSRLFAQERGSSAYELYTNDKIHARWVRCDDKLFSLGDSIKDIAKGTTFTVSRMDANTENLRAMYAFKNDGTELFGPNRAIHA